MTRQEFINKFYSYAEIAAKALKTDPYYIISQWILETGGQENSSHNLAGIGAFDNPLSRQTIYGEYYDNYMDFTNAYIKYIKADFPLVIGSKTINEFASGLEHGKFGRWATAKDYHQKIVAVYNSITNSNITSEDVNLSETQKIEKGLESVGINMPSWLNTALDTLKLSAVYILLIIAVLLIIFYSGKEILK